jgi:transposase-like protein
VGDIQAHLQKIYGAEVSSSLISKVTDAVAKEVKA